MVYAILWMVVNGGILLASRAAALRTHTPAAPQSVRSVGNVVEVDDRLWRSAGPSTDARYEAFRRLGVTTVVDLRQLGPAATRAEADRLARLGLRSVVIPVPDGGSPRPLRSTSSWRWCGRPGVECWSTAGGRDELAPWWPPTWWRRARPPGAKP